MIEVTLSEKGRFIKAEWFDKDQIAIFPVTEKSIARSGAVISPHPLCDEFSYLSMEMDENKHQSYLQELQDWLHFAKDGPESKWLNIIYQYIQSGSIFNDCITSLFAGCQYHVDDEFAVVVCQEKKADKTLKMNKVFVTFQVETRASIEENFKVTTSKALHHNYIAYIRDKNAKKIQSQCDISNELTYCANMHRGLLGNAKLISTSTHNETYFGRFNDGEEVIHIGYETSQKIHLMIKYLLDNNQNSIQLSKDCYLMNWFSDDIGNEERIQVTGAISPYDDDDGDEQNYQPKTLGESNSMTLNDYITGKERDVNPNGKFYLMIVDKISNGRIAMKYFQELPKSELFKRVERWYETTKWPSYDGIKQKYINKTPSLIQYATALYGIEMDKGYLECKSDKWKGKTVERLLPCVLGQKKDPQRSGEAHVAKFISKKCL